MFDFNDDDLFKARPHKYVKRTGTPGNFRYWYKLPDGRIVEGDEEQQKQGRKDHVMRLLIAKKHGKHSMSNSQIADYTGYTNDAEPDEGQTKKQKAVHNINGSISGAKRRAQRAGHSPDDWHIHGHDYESHHYEHSHKDDHSEEHGETPAPESSREAEVADAESRLEAHEPGQPPSAHSEPKRYEAMAGEGMITLKDVEMVEGTDYAIGRHQREYRIIATTGRVLPGRYESREDAEEYPMSMRQRQVTPVAEAVQRDISEVENKQKAKELQKLTQKLSSQFGINLDEPVATSQPEPAPARPRRARRPRAQAQTQAPTDEEARTRAEEARAQAEALAQASGPDAPQAAEVHQADPVLAQDDEPIRRMIESQARGENPYLNRAKEIFERTQAHMEPKMRASLAKFFTVMSSLAPDSSEATIKAEYDRGRARGDDSIHTFSQLKSKIGTYHGVYMEMDEIINNEPVNPEVERMKRGYGRKQFERMRAYVKDSWHQSNPDAPPPYPTFGDLKSWNEHGHRPDWVSPRAQIAIPREVHDAAPVIDGKVQLPPRWMPIHLMPVWNYAVKSAGASDYAGTPNSNQITGSTVNLPTQGDLRSHILNSVRKYVQARGGVEQLVDIPSSKMSNELSYQDIFKGMSFDPHNLSDSALKKIMRHKIIDPIAIAPYIKEELMANKPIKRSYELVIDLGLSAITLGGQIAKSENGVEDLKKSELIRKIKAKKEALKSLRIRG